jgi:hypothetical protein
MQVVFLHILADTLGSVGVIISAILMHLFGWMIADPICSIFIAILIALSVGSLVKESMAVLMQRTPKQLDNVLVDYSWRGFREYRRPISGPCAPTTTVEDLSLRCPPTRTPNTLSATLR